MTAEGLSGLVRKIQHREISCEQLTLQYLERIRTLQPAIDAYAYVAGEQAVETARKLDYMLAHEGNAGSLAGMPVSVKQLIAVDGMPSGAGSRCDVADLIGAQGGFVTKLHEAGCVILGTTRTTEFAFTTMCFSHPQPWNPWRSDAHYITGGSSQGAAAAQAAGLAAVSIGTDTGGSIRGPAAYCGVVGYVPTRGLWPVDGMFPLLPISDTIGVMTDSVTDLVFFYEALEGTRVPMIELEDLRLGLPSQPFYKDLEDSVEARINSSLDHINGAGVCLVPVELPRMPDVLGDYSKLFRANIIGTLGIKRFAECLDVMDANTRSQLLAIPEITEKERRDIESRVARLRATATEKFMSDLDGWILPTLPLTAPMLGTIDSEMRARTLQHQTGRNLSFVNKLGFTAVTLPAGLSCDGLPVGLQLVAAAGEDARLLGMARAVENILGSRRRPELAGFIRPC